MLRDRRHIRMGVVAMDGVYRMRDRLASGLDHAMIERSVREALTGAIANIRALDSRLKLSSGIEMAALVALGLGQDPDAKAYSLIITRAFALGATREIEAAFANALTIEYDGDCLAEWRIPAALVSGANL
jgi:hypothetical protein